LSAERNIVFAVAVMALAISGFTIVAEETMEGETLRFDNAVLAALRSPSNPAVPIGPDWLLPAAQDITALGGTAVIVLLILCVSGYFVLQKKVHTAMFLITSVAGGTAANLILKEFFSRPRPSAVPHLAHFLHASFPSGHTMISAIVYLTLAAMLAKSTTSLRLKFYFLTVGVTISLLIGLSRLFLGVHYPTDVLAGWCGALAWAGLTYLLAAWLQRRGKVEHES